MSQTDFILEQMSRADVTGRGVREAIADVLWWRPEKSSTFTQEDEALLVELES